MRTSERAVIRASYALTFLCLVYGTPAPAEMLGRGAAFPAWQMQDHEGTLRSSNEFTGRAYLLWFYPKASTPGCTAEGRALRDAYVEIQSTGLAVVGVSFDKPEANAEFASAEGFPFPLLSDTERKLALAVGAAESAGQWYARRISYLVGADGSVLVAYESVDPASHAAEVLKDFRARTARQGAPAGKQENGS
jgi:peroxiredoxin Q/BCP